MRFGIAAALCGVMAFGLSACGEKTYQPERFSAGPNLGFAKAFSADELAGRAPGTEASTKARGMIIDRFEKLGVLPVNGTFEHVFLYGPFVNPETGEEAVPNKPGTNVMGVIKGTSESRLVMVVTAHYDHLGVKGDEIYNGMDDNASGVTGLLAAAEYFTENAPQHDVMLVAFDAEEDGFGGARDFISNPPLPLERIAFNLNFDMISRGDNELLWASGAAHWPALKPLIEGVAADAPVTIKMGFDEGEGREDWTMLSDHMVFFRAGIPHLYLGVEDHADYHKPSDTFDKVNQDWFLRALDTVVAVAAAADARLDEIADMRER